MSLISAPATRLPLVRHNQLTGADKYGNNPLRPQNLSDQYIQGSAIGIIDEGISTPTLYVSFPEIPNIQAIELYASATSELSWTKEPFEDGINDGTRYIQPPTGNVYYSTDGLEVSNVNKVWSPLIEFDQYGGDAFNIDIDAWQSVSATVNDDSAVFGNYNRSIALTYGRINLPIKESNLKNLIVRFQGYNESVDATFYTSPEDGGRAFMGKAGSSCSIFMNDIYCYAIQDGPSAYDKAPLILAITTQPTSSGYSSLALNESTTITDNPIVATGNGTLTYQWYKTSFPTIGSVQLENPVSISGATSNDYSLSSAQTNDAGIYYCELTNTVASKSVKLKTEPISVNVGTGLARLFSFQEGPNAFWIDKPNLSDSSEFTYAYSTAPPIPLSYTTSGQGNYTNEYDQQYYVSGLFRTRPISSGKMIVKYQKVGSTNSLNTIASAKAEYTTNGGSSWSTFATALGTDGTTGIIFYELTSLPLDAGNLGLRFEKNIAKGYNASTTPVSSDISTYVTGTGDPWTTPENAINSSGTSASGTASAANLVFEEIYSCSTVGTAQSIVISGSASYDLQGSVDSSLGIFGSTNFVVGGAILTVSYSINNGSTWSSPIFLRSAGADRLGGLLTEAPTPTSATGTNIPFSQSISSTDIDISKVKIKLNLEISYNSLLSDDGFGNTEYIEASGIGSATIKNLELKHVPPTIEISTAEFRINDVYLEYDTDQALSDTVTLLANKTTVSSGGPVVLTPHFSGSGSISGGVGSVVSGTSYTVNPISTTTYTLTVGSVTKSVTVTVPSSPTATSLTPGSSELILASPLASTTLTPIFSNGTGVVTPGNISVTSNSSITVTPSATTTYTLTVTSSLGVTVTTTATITVVATPSSNLSRGAAIVTNTNTTTITPTFFGGTAVIGTSGQDSSNVANPATSGTGITVTPASNSTTTYTLTVTSPANQKTTSAVSISAVAAPTITSFTVNGGSSVNITVGNTVTLLGTFTGSGSVSNSVGTITTNINKVVTVSSTGTLTYTLTASNTATTSATASSSVTINSYAVPIATSLVVGASSITNGTSTTLTPTFSNGTGSINNSVGSVTSTTSYTVSPTTTTTYTLTVTNAAGTTATTTATITVVAAPVATSLTPTSSTVSVGSSTTLTPVFSGGTCKIGTTVGGNQITANATSGTGITVTPASTQTYYMTVTNSLNATATITATITVVPLPIITSLVASQSSITAGSSLNITPTFSNGTGSINNSVGSVTSTTSYTVSPTTTTTYTLTVTNAAGATTSQSLTITVYPVPTASMTITPSIATIILGDEIILNPIFTGGTGSINGFTVTSEVGKSYYPTVTTTFILTVTNPLGAVATSTIEVTVYPYPNATSLTLATSFLLRGSSTTITPVFSGGPGKIGTTLGGNDVTASATSGTPITISPDISKTYYLTVMSDPSAPRVVTSEITTSLSVYVRPSSFSCPGDPENGYSKIVDNTPQDSSTFSGFFPGLLSDGVERGYIEFNSLIVTGTAYIKYQKTPLYSEYTASAGSYLTYATNGITYSNQIAAVTSGDAGSGVESTSFSFSGNLANLKFGVDYAKASGTQPGECSVYGPYNPEPPYDRDCIEYLPDQPVYSTAGFYIFDVYFNLEA